MQAVQLAFVWLGQAICAGQGHGSKEIEAYGRRWTCSDCGGDMGAADVWGLFDLFAQLGRSLLPRVVAKMQERGARVCDRCGLLEADHVWFCRVCGQHVLGLTLCKGGETHHEASELRCPLDSDRRSGSGKAAS